MRIALHRRMNKFCAMILPVALAASLLATSQSFAAPVVDETLPVSGHEAVAQPGIVSMRDFLVVMATATENGQQRANALIDGGGTGIDRIEKLLRITTPEEANRDDFTAASQVLLETERGRVWLADVAKLRNEFRYNQCVDMYFVDKTFAVVFTIYVPKTNTDRKTLRVFYLTRDSDEWHIAIDPNAEITALTDDAKRVAYKKLRTIADARQREIIAIINKPLERSLPLEGTWATHFQQENLLLFLTSSGTATVFIVKRGAMSTEVCDYTVAGDDVTIESSSGPLRLKIERERHRTQDGKDFYGLIAERGDELFIGAPQQPLRLAPYIPGDRPVSRPQTANADKKPPAPDAEKSADKDG